MLRRTIAAVCRDRVLPLGVPLAIGWLVWMGAQYAQLTAGSGQRTPLSMCLEAPAACDGRPVVLPLWQVVEIFPDRYTAFSASVPLTVIGDTSELSPGTRVSLSGSFDAEEMAIVEAEREVHTLRRAKEILSLVGLLFVIGVAARSFSWRDGRARVRG